MKNSLKPRWNEEEIAYLKENYGVKNSREIGLFLDRSMDSVQIKARKLGLRVEKKYNFNRDFFETIDNHEKAYWLGFIVADGYVLNDSERRNYELGISLKDSDRDHLKKFNKSIQGNFEVKTRKRNIDILERTGSPKEYNLCEIRVYSKKYVNDLSQYSVVQGKTYKDINLPNLSDDLMWSYIRGYLDGDGHIMLREKRSHSVIGFTCISEGFLEQIQRFFLKFDISSKIILNKKEDNNSKNIYQLVIRANKSKLNFLENCYSNQSVYLERKYKNYLLLKSALS